MFIYKNKSFFFLIINYCFSAAWHGVINLWHCWDVIEVQFALIVACNSFVFMGQCFLFFSSQYRSGKLVGQLSAVISISKFVSNPFGSMQPTSRAAIREYGPTGTKVPGSWEQLRKTNSTTDKCCNKMSFRGWHWTQEDKKIFREVKFIQCTVVHICLTGLARVE